MSDDIAIEDVGAEETVDATNDLDLTIEQLNELMILSKLSQLKEDFASKGINLKERQDKVRWLHNLMQRVNKRVDKETGELDLTHAKIDEVTGELKEGEEIGDDKDLESILTLRRMMKEAAEDRGYEIEPKGKYTKDERERMNDSLRLICDDLNLQNDMELQDLNQLINERYEVYQMARAILKPLHEDKLHKARAMSGR